LVLFSRFHFDDIYGKNCFSIKTKSVSIVASTVKGGPSKLPDFEAQAD
jgi:hypothetical protein